MSAISFVLISLLAAGADGLSQERFLTAERLIESGDYEGALRMLNGVQCRPEDGETCQPRTHAMRGAALLFSGRYDQAVAALSEALKTYRRQGNAKQAVDLLNNIGTVHFYKGEYAEAYSRYQEAQQELSGRRNEKWFASGSQLTSANMATLYQRLGKYREALEVYRGLGPAPEGLAGSEQAQLLSNLAALNRRLGDPWKARSLLERALLLVRRERHSDAWLGATKNLGILLALDFGDSRAAEQKFGEALRAAESSGNAREAMQARLYLAEAHFRRGASESASALWQETLAESRRLKTAEEEWRSHYGLARVLLRAGRRTEAEAEIRRAMETVESLRGGIGVPTMKTEFLADKSEVYEAALSIQAEKSDVDGAMETMERARALQLQEGLGAMGERPRLATFQRRLEEGEAALLYKAGRGQSFVVWATRRSAGLRRIELTEGEAARLVQRIRADVDGAAEEKGVLAERLLKDIPPLREGGTRRVWIAVDGVFALAPLDLLPLDGRMMIERFEVAYTPAASLFRRRAARELPVRWPWERELLAYADPDVRGLRLLPGDDRWAPLPESGEEAGAARKLLPGRGTIYRGLEVTPAEFIRRAAGVPVIHLATHGAGDPESSQRNRMLVGSGYLYGGQLTAGRLEGVHLAVLSACDTNAGTLSWGEGVQSLARSFLLAGARAAVSSLWKVDDRSTRLFMEEFYRGLAAGRGAAAALRETKLRFLRSGGAFSAPRHWAAFVAQGAADEPLPRWLSWRDVAWWLAAFAAFAALGAHLVNRRRGGA